LFVFVFVFLVVIEDEVAFLSLTIHHVTKTIPKIGNAEMKIYGNIANKVEGSNKDINYTKIINQHSNICFIIDQKQ
jgi:hypothetical protein